MIKEAYKVEVVYYPEGADTYPSPIIKKVPITDLEGVSWRDAKKQLRQWYLAQAAALRQVSEKTYFGE